MGNGYRPLCSEKSRQVDRLNNDETSKMNIPNRIRYINKRFTNRFMGLIAGKKGSPVALIRHMGRVSGNIYATPILVARASGGFIFALTYGDHVDWYKNTLAASGGTLVLNGSEIKLIDPIDVDPVSARKAFQQPFKTLLTWMGTQRFFYMKKA